MNRANKTIGVYSQGYEVNLTTISSEIQSHTLKTKNSGDNYDGQREIDRVGTNEVRSTEYEFHITYISYKLAQ